MLNTALIYLLVNHLQVVEIPKLKTDYLTPENTKCMALNVYYEARNQSTDGMIAVASVTMNRVNDSRYPNTPCKVITQKSPVNRVCHFSWYCENLSLSPNFLDEYGTKITKEVNAYRKSYNIALLVLTNIIKDNTNNATHYYNHNIVKPNWSKYYEETVVYSDHTFMHREPGNPF